MKRKITREQLRDLVYESVNKVIDSKSINEAETPETQNTVEKKLDRIIELLELLALRQRETNDQIKGLRMMGGGSRRFF